MNVLVTGGAGYIGSAVVEELLADGHTPVVYDNLVAGHPEAVPEGVVLVRGDLHDAPLLEQTLEAHGIEAVIHLAAFLQPNESMTRPGKYFDNNVGGSIALLNAMAAHDVRRFILSSTCATFGNPQRLPIDEDHPQQPISPYGVSKYIIEQMLPWYELAHGIRFSCMRYFNACGATPTRGEDHDPEIHLVPLILHVAMGKRDSIKIYGSDYDTRDGSAIRDYVHISDLGRAHVLALAPLAERSRNFNLGNGDGFTVREVIDAARRVTGHPIPTIEEPRRAGDPPVMIGDSRRARAELGWAPRYPHIEQIIQTAWDWHRTHPNGYR
ncbi:MAG: UDP-glucose 4-epimerase GalE [Chloroflexales bacterium]|nr:UDP-glucose 4-epimerase GalE [Chloroflexales bacterium]